MTVPPLVALACEILEDRIAGTLAILHKVVMSRAVIVVACAGLTGVGIAVSGEFIEGIVCLNV